jgi:hypothetical protein
MKYLLFVLILFTNLQNSNSQTTRWKVVWDKNPEDDIKEYIVYKGLKSETTYMREIARIKSPDTTFVDKKIEAGILYYYRIKAVNNKGVSSNYSNPCTAAIPAFKNLPRILGISKNKSIELLISNYIYDPDNATHKIHRINSKIESKINVELNSGNLILRVKEKWKKSDTDTVSIKVIDSNGFYSIANILLVDESKVDNEPAVPLNKEKSYDITIYPNEFILSQFSKITFSNIPNNSNISIFDTFGTLVYSKKNISNTFSWYGKNEENDQVLFGLYNYVITDKLNIIISEGFIRVTP